MRQMVRMEMVQLCVKDFLEVHIHRYRLSAGLNPDSLRFQAERSYQSATVPSDLQHYDMDPST